MKLAKIEVKHGERLEWKQLDYLNDRYESLDSLIDSRYGGRVYLSTSRMSEAAYAEIEMPNDETYTISLRNHNNLETSSYNEALWFSNFATYSEMKKTLIKRLDEICGK